MQCALRALTGGLIWAALVTYYCASATDNAGHEPNPIKPQDDGSVQMDNNDLNMVKRAWNNMPMSWGKRAWRNLQSTGWGKRFAPEASYSDKRAWQKFQGGWGKRWTPEDEWSLAESSETEPMQYDEYGAAPSGPEFDDIMDEEKRTWRALNSAWGKRATHDWGSFRGSWGKRDPAWNNLKGLWGKRSIQDRITS